VQLLVALSALGSALSPSAPRAQPQGAVQYVAVVEDLSGLAGFSRLDLLAPGQQIDLGENGRIVLGFLDSCWEDSVTGGRIVVEARRSRVEGGDVVRRRVECDPSGLAKLVSTGSFQQRAIVPIPGDELPEPDVVLFGRSPVVLSGGADRVLIIERLDVPDPPLQLEIATGRIDFLDRKIELEPRGLYRFATNGASIVAQIDELAEAGPSPIVGRLLVFH
jgi:hypothetical protein